MNVLIVGENSCNDRVIEYFSQKGLKPTVLADVYKLRSLRGEAGSFVAYTKDDEIKADFVILTEQPNAEPIEINGLLSHSLYVDNKNTITQKIEPLEPVVLLLDYVCESPMAATIRALFDAAELARGKRRVYYLARFVRTAGRGIETLYREARDAGVTFIKYEDLNITADLNTEVFSVKVSDGVLESEFKTRAIFSDGGSDVGERFAYAVKKLNLTLNKHGCVTEDLYYLTPALTSRRGIYHLTRDLVAERLNEGLDYIYTCVKSELWDVPSHGSAVIDGEKCAFCYNCYRACAHAALEPDKSTNKMQCLSIACAGCGTCASLCPGNAITLEKDTFSDPAIHVGATTPGHPPALVICCENSGITAIKDFLTGSEKDCTGVKVLSAPCGGVIDMELLTDGLDLYNNVMAVVCPDDACRHFDGNKRACAQADRLTDMLSAAGLSPEKIRYSKASHAMPGVLRDELKDFLLS